MGDLDGEDGRKSDVDVLTCRDDHQSELSDRSEDAQTHVWKGHSDVWHCAILPVESRGRIDR